MAFWSNLIRPGPNRLSSIGAIRRAFTSPSYPPYSFHSHSFFSSRNISLSPSLSHHSHSSTPSSILLRSLRQTFTRKYASSSRRFASNAPKAAQGPKRYPERLLIYHAGTPRTTFLACLKVTTLFGLAFFTFLVAPAYFAADKPLWQILGVTICGLVPFIIVSYTSTPFVVFIHLRLPTYARHPDRELLRRFVRNIPANTQMDITTLNLIGRPRLATVSVGDLIPAHERLRIVNFIDTQASASASAADAAGAASVAKVAGTPATKTMPGTAASTKQSSKYFVTSSQFPFVHLKQATHFGAPPGNNTRGVQFSWAWEDLLAIIGRRSRQPENNAP